MLLIIGASFCFTASWLYPDEDDLHGLELTFKWLSIGLLVSVWFHLQFLQFMRIHIDIIIVAIMLCDVM